MPSRLTVLVVGSGAREHALTWALNRSPSVGRLLVAPGNPGTAELAENLALRSDDLPGIVDAALAQRVDLVVVGPEVPLAMGLADRLAERGVPVFGPTRAAAELEWSKTFAKRFMQEHGIPTASYQSFDDPTSALRALVTSRYPLVVKADGLAAGKGVTICQTQPEAAAAVRAAMIDREFGAAGCVVVLEECLQGEEVSVIALTDGERIATLPPARDYKRIGEGDQGPNTGGMGSYAPSEALSTLALAQIERAVLQPTVDALRALGRPYRGALYAGLMLTVDGPKVLEFNCRFGDPETQVLLPLIESDLAESLLACAQGRLLRPIATRSGSAVCTVLAVAGYPANPSLGQEIHGLEPALAGGALVFHAGTERSGERLLTSGGRVLSVVGLGADLEQATERSYAAAEKIHFAGRQFRRDLAARGAASA